MDSFDDLYDLWPNKRDKANTKLAYDYLSKRYDFSPRDYIKAATLWIAKASEWLKENQTLAHWLRDEKFKEELKEIASCGGSIETALENVEMYRQAAIVVAGEWNRLRNKWWASIEDIQSRSYCIEAALRNDFFQMNWPKALRMAKRIFDYPEKDNLGRIKLTPNIEWFCDLKETTVSKIIEGYFGAPTPKTVIEKHERTVLNQEERQNFKALFESTKSKILGEDKPWTVRVGFTSIDLCYLGEKIDVKMLPPIKEDQDALKATMQNQADMFNAKGYRPNILAQKEFDKKQEQEQEQEQSSYEDLLDI